MLQLAAGAIGPGRLIGAALAGGLNLYLTVAFLGIGSRLAWFELPVGLRGLENELLLASALVLLAIEVVTDKVRLLDSLWDAAHTIIRPGGTGLLAFLALEGWPLGVRVAGALLAGLVAFGAHAAKAGLRVIVNLSDRRWNAPLSLAEDALALLAAVMVLPATAPFVTGFAVIVLLVAGPRPWRAAGLGVRAAIARLRGFFGEPGWREPEELPRRFRELAAPDPHGVRPARFARAAVSRLPGTGAYRTGWLVLDARGAALLCDARLRPRRLPLPAVRETNVVSGLLTEAIRCTTDGRDFILFLLRDGPPAELVAAELGPANG